MVVFYFKFCGMFVWCINICVVLEKSKMFGLDEYICIRSACRVENCKCGENYFFKDLEI